MKSDILAVDPGFGDIKLQVNTEVIKITAAIARARPVFRFRRGAGQEKSRAGGSARD